MARRAMSRLFWLTAFLPLLGAPARANSITTYGVIITAMGNDLQVQYVDQAEAQAAISGSKIYPTVGSDGGSAGTATSLPGTGSVSTSGTIATPGGAVPSTAGMTSPGAVSSGTVANTANNELLITPNGSGGITVMPFAPPPSMTPTSFAPPTVAVAGNTPGSGSVINTGTVSVPQPVFVVAGGDPIPVGSTPTPTSAAKTPEPASIALLALAGLGGLYARRGN